MTNNISITKEQYKLFEDILNEFEKLRTLSPEEKEDLILSITSRTYIDLMCDWAFKHVFGHDECNLIPLLNDILSTDIVSIDYESNEIDRWKEDDKNVIMDVLCHTKDGTRFIVEMQRADKEHLRNRLFYYGASMASTQLKRGDSYGKLMPVYVVCFMNFCLRHDSDHLVYRYQIRDNDGERYGSQLTICLCELPRLVSKPRGEMTPIEIWFDILKNMTNFAKRPAEYGARYEGVFEASRQLPISLENKKQYMRSMFDYKERSYLTDEDRAEIRAEALAEGKAEGIAEGKAEGIAEGKAEVAKVLKSMGLDESVIFQSTGLKAEDLT